MIDPDAALFVCESIGITFRNADGGWYADLPEPDIRFNASRLVGWGLTKTSCAEGALRCLVYRSEYASAKA